MQGLSICFLLRIMMNRRTAKLIRLTAHATNKHYRSLKKAFNALTQKDKCAARKEMIQAFRRKNETQKTEA